MNKEQQIEEMARILSYQYCIPLWEAALSAKSSCIDDACNNCEAEKMASTEMAKALYDAGYRKAGEAERETAREIYEWLKVSLTWDEEGIIGRFAETYDLEVKK